MAWIRYTLNRVQCKQLDGYKIFDDVGPKMNVSNTGHCDTEKSHNPMGLIHGIGMYYIAHMCFHSCSITAFSWSVLWILSLS